MRLIDADALYEKTAEWEAQALAYVEKLEPTEDHEKWVKWTAILNERTAFKHDVADAPTVDPVKHGKWYDEQNYLGTRKTMYFCSYCGSASYREDPYCWHCGSKMDVSDTDVGKKEEVKHEI